MAIEIRELHIRAVVDDAAGKSTESPRSSQGKSASSPEDNSEQVVEMCVAKVLEILQQRTER
jgi:hypothetical protein